ncbi:hypothetical protein IE81DRAFT_324059 [Ceraceosorus guamensis]|uniref:Uncharacterized protein n=1 Tax=Ceraceosorus guamensis TaxID=1522189 RepID=A0A316VW92_9BASI|nr:hypothetical protein IE81DRAFT_324059 [Ceraceosorus guamensis]PWN41886.1 hypothetical protein IE81DRAFT_324059 [Ceraceosorus guamensis]
MVGDRVVGVLRSPPCSAVLFLYTHSMVRYSGPTVGNTGRTVTDDQWLVGVPDVLIQQESACGRNVTIVISNQTRWGIVVDSKSSPGINLSPALFQEFAPLNVGRIDNAVWYFSDNASQGTQGEPGSNPNQSEDPENTTVANTDDANEGEQRNDEVTENATEAGANDDEDEGSDEIEDANDADAHAPGAGTATTTTTPDSDSAAHSTPEASSASSNSGSSGSATASSVAPGHEHQEHQDTTTQGAEGITDATDGHDTREEDTDADHTSENHGDAQTQPAEATQMAVS